MQTKFHPFPELNTQRLQLRQLTPEDAPEIFIHRSDPRIVAFTAIPPGQTLEDARHFIQKINTNVANDTSVYWAIALKNTLPLIGTICLWNFSLEQSSAEIGYSLHPDFQGQGYMQEAFSAVVQYAFEAMELECMEACLNLENTPSVRLLARNNFVHTGESDGLAVFTQTKTGYFG